MASSQPYGALAPAPVLSSQLPDTSQDPEIAEATAKGENKAHQIAVSAEKEQFELDAARRRADRREQSFEQIIDNLKPPAMDLPPPPKPQETNPIQEWGSIAMIFAALASRKTRTPATTALQAGAAALNGFRQRDEAATEAAYKQWEAASKNALEMHEYQKEIYDSILQRAEHGEDIASKEYDRDRETIEARFQATARAMGDEDAARLSELGMYGARDDLMIKRSELATKLAEANGKVTETYAFQRAVQSYQNSPEGKAATPEQQFAHITGLVNQMAPTYGKSPAWQAVRDGGVDKIAEGIASGKQPPTLTGLYGLSGLVRANLEDKGVDLTSLQLEYQSAQRQINSLNGPQMTRFAGLGKSVVNTIDEVKRLSQQMDLYGVPLFNRAEIQAYVQTQGNTPSGQLAAQYLTAVNTLKEEFANLATGGYAPHESAWALANTQINSDYGVKELGASLDEVQRLINYRLMSIPGMTKYGPGAANPYLGTEGLSGAAGWGTTNNPAAEGKGGTPAPDADGWVKMPDGTRIREVQ